MKEKTDQNYFLIDSGDGKKLEQVGPYRLIRPCYQAAWSPRNQELWDSAQAAFSREPMNCWEGRESLPDSWKIEIEGINFLIKATDFGHLGVFPEQRAQWKWIRDKVASSGRQVSVLNLFAYSGGSTLAAALGGAEVCHLDASKGMVSWARENASLNQLEEAPIRWIAEDALKFILREEKRGRRYDAIILDPPTFGRGAKGEVFKIEEMIIPLLDGCNRLLSDNPLFVLLSSHTPGYTPTVLHHLLLDRLGTGTIEAGEMLLQGDQTWEIPSGVYGRWIP